MCFSGVKPIQANACSREVHANESKSVSYTAESSWHYIRDYNDSKLIPSAFYPQNTGAFPMQ